MRSFARCPHGFVVGANLCPECEHPRRPTKSNKAPTANPVRLTRKCDRCDRHVPFERLRMSAGGWYAVCIEKCEAPGGVIGLGDLRGK